MNYLVIDLEMCNVPRDYRSRSYKYANETIQIGAVLLDEEFKRIGTLVIDEINRYIDSCCDKKVSVKGMVYKLVKAPYGMRAGVIPFYLAYVLANRREDIIVYFSNKEVQITSDIVVNMCEQPED